MKLNFKTPNYSNGFIIKYKCEGFTLIWEMSSSRQWNVIHTLWCFIAVSTKTTEILLFSSSITLQTFFENFVFYSTGFKSVVLVHGWSAHFPLISVLAQQHWKNYLNHIITEFVIRISSFFSVQNKKNHEFVYPPSPL